MHKSCGIAVARVCAAIMALAIAAAGSALAEQKTSVTVGLRVEPPGLDSTVVTSEIISVVTLGNIHEGLTRITEQNTVEPRLATDWTVSDDGLTYTFELLEGVKFSDGSDFDAGDVKWTFERNGGKDSSNFNKATFANMESIETPDPHTVVIKLKKPDSLLPYRLGMGVSVVVAPETAETNATNPVGTGAFKFEEWVKGDSITLVRNETFREPERVTLERIEFKIIEDPAAQVAAVRAGDVDVFPMFSAPESGGQFEADPNIEVLNGANETEVVIGFNNARKPFTDVRVRRAVAHAVDREAVIDGAEFGFGVPIGSHFPVNHPAYIDLTDVNPYDPEMAKALLAEAGHEGGFETTLLVPPQAFAVRSAEIVAAYLAEVGIEAKIDKRQWAQFIDLAIKTNDFDMLIVDHIQSLDIAIYNRPDFIYLYDNQEFRNIWDRVEGALSVDERVAALQDAQRHIAQTLPTVPMYNGRSITVKKKGLQGIWTDMPHLMAEMTDVRWTN